MSRVKKTYDVVVIGGGPAGMSAASWCSELGLETVLVEGGTEVGGQLLKIYNPVSNYLGIRANNGREIADNFIASIRDAVFERLVETRIVNIDPGSMCARTSNGSEIQAAAFVIATGVRRRSLGILGESEFIGNGLIESGARDAHLLEGKSVLIVGGGDAAFENALILSKFAAEVAVAFRKPEPAAREEFLNSARELPNVRLLPETVLTRIYGNSRIESVEFESGLDRRRSVQSVDAVLIRIGVEPNSELVRDLVDLDRDGYIVVNRNGETSTPGILAIGDVAYPNSPTISTATGSGATAAKTIYCSIAGRRRMIRT